MRGPQSGVHGESGEHLLPCALNHSMAHVQEEVYDDRLLGPDCSSGSEPDSPTEPAAPGRVAKLTNGRCGPSAQQQCGDDEKVCQHGAQNLADARWLGCERTVNRLGSSLGRTLKCAAEVLRRGG